MSETGLDETVETGSAYSTPPSTATDTALQAIYFNGVEIGLSLSDMTALLMRNGERLCALHMSFTTAKTFAAELSRAVADFEKATDHNIMTMHDIRPALLEIQNQSLREKE
ncbi:MAG: hypothetical protein OYG32_16665 [Rhodospirillaceae bacterium]|nr:hypothetical protein [Rhodospirillaceae bacterium]MDE0256426.1 hypothetical protein [Rhodospirillaceae bacterium]MDE0619193.1 hypothetical protein [Rhodospirillaceae bacterium]